MLAESQAGGPPVPPDSSYLGELSGAAQQAVMDLLMRGSELLDIPRWAVGALAAAVAGLAFLLIARAALSRLRGRRPPEEVGVVAGAALPAAVRDAAAWRAELERCLAEERIAGALEAAWWWLARSLAGERAAADWTSRDLLAQMPRRESLFAAVRRLDAWTYGPRPPGADELRRLVGRLEAELA